MTASGPRRRRHGQRGMALVTSVITILILVATVAALVPLAVSERLLTTVSRESAECRYAAEAILAHAISELQARDDWSAALSGAEPAAFVDVDRTPWLTRARQIDLDAVTSSLPLAEPGNWGSDRPRWQLFAWGPARRLAPGVVSSPLYVAAWVADDGRDGDGRPDRDANGRLSLHGVAFGPLGGRRAVVAAVVREAPAPAALRVPDWHAP